MRALNWLAEDYRRNYPGACVETKAEAAVRRSRGFSGRADGLLAVLDRQGKIRTVAMEAKSLRTSSAFQAQTGCVLMLAAALAAAGLTVALSVAALSGLLGRGIAVGVGAVAGTAFGLGVLRVLADLRALNPRSVVLQVCRYPAGERWIAITADLHRDRPDEVAAVTAICRDQGIGLVVVPRTREPTLLLSPRPAILDCLSEYHGGAELRAKLLVAAVAAGAKRMQAR